MTGPWDRDLATDLDVIEAWGADAVVTLMEDHELAAVKVANLGDLVEARGMEWYHLPIRDVDVPDDRFECRWAYAGSAAPSSRYRRAGSAALWGSLGRTGTIAAPLLVEFEENPRAGRSPRSGRCGEVQSELAEQERHVLAAMPPALDEPYADRLLGSLLGSAIGDAFGYTVEFSSLSHIRKQFGAAGLQAGRSTRTAGSWLATTRK